IRVGYVTGVQTCALPISAVGPRSAEKVRDRSGGRVYSRVYQRIPMTLPSRSYSCSPLLSRPRTDCWFSRLLFYARRDLVRVFLQTGVRKMSGVVVSLLGRFRVETEGEKLCFPTRKAESLLACLILHPQGLQRVQLASLLWPDTEDELARRNL